MWNCGFPLACIHLFVLIFDIAFWNMRIHFIKKEQIGSYELIYKIKAVVWLSSRTEKNHENKYCYLFDKWLRSTKAIDQTLELIITQTLDLYNFFYQLLNHFYFLSFLYSHACFYVSLTKHDIYMKLFI